MKRIWVVSLSIPYEGLSPPEAAFKSKQDAIQYARLKNKDAWMGGYEVNECVVMDFVSEEPKS